MLTKPPLKSASRDDQLRAIEENGVMGALGWGDIFFDIEANQMAARLYGEAVARIVKDPETAASLTPSHPFGCKRPIIDQGYYETFNRDNVTLVDLRKDPIVEITPTGIRTEQQHHDLDVIIYATGFDAMTGALTRIDIRGRDGMSLADFWTSEGPLYATSGSRWRGSPTCSLCRRREAPRRQRTSSPHLNSTWSGSATASPFCVPGDHRTIEALPDAQHEWIEHTTALVAPTVLVHPSCNSWYNGGNVPGRNACTWATRRGSRNTGGGATRSRPRATQGSSSHEGLGTRPAHRPGFRRGAAAGACRGFELR